MLLQALLTQMGKKTCTLISYCEHYIALQLIDFTIKNDALSLPQTTQPQRIKLYSAKEKDP